MVRCSNCGWDNPEGLRSCEKCNAPLIFDVFISYSRKDYVDDAGNVLENNILSKIKDALKANEMSYWFDEDGIYSGDEFASVLTNAIRNSRIFLFISSVNSNQSKWTSNEISTALEFEKPIIPFRIDNSPYNDSVMMKIVSLDRIECNNKDIAITKLLRAIRHHLPNQISPKQRSLEVPHYDIFISYSYEYGFDAAKSIYNWLSREGYSVFFDEYSLRTGKRDAQSIKQTLHCKDFLLFVDRHFTDRLSDEDDWVRNELSIAIKRGCNEVNIIPITMNDLINNRNTIIKKLFSRASQLNDFYSRTPEVNIIPRPDIIEQEVGRKAIEMLLAMVRSSTIK